MNSIMIDKITAKINARGEELRTLIDEANKVLPKCIIVGDVSVETFSDRVDICIKGNWEALITNGGRWNFKCSADNVWDGVSTDTETLKRLKMCFDLESEHMDQLRKVIDSVKAENKEVYDFFA